MADESPAAAPDPTASPSADPSWDAVGYRRFVGPKDEYDAMAGLQFTVMYMLGLREQHRFLDVGCGSLRGGRLFIPYLGTGNYYGVEPSDWLIEEGIKENLGQDLIDLKQPTFSNSASFGFAEFGVEFDYILAQSIFSHTFDDLLMQGLANARDALAPGGTIVANFAQARPLLGQYTKQPRGKDGKGFRQPGLATYTTREFKDALDRANLAGAILPLTHPRLKWFVAVKRAESDRLAELTHLAKGALHPSLLKRTKRSAYLAVQRIKR